MPCAVSRWNEAWKKVQRIETHDVRLKRLRMRSMRRGIKEMDLLLMSFADQKLESLSSDQLDLYEALLEENDQDLYAWVSGQDTPPERFAEILSEVAATYRAEGL